MKELLIRTIALWVIFIASLGLVIWSGEQLTVTLVKKASGGYQEAPASGYNPVGMGGYGGGYYNPCLQPPMYPPISGPGMPEQTTEDKKALEKYNEEYAKYTEKLQETCLADLQRQQEYQKNQAQSAYMTDLAVYLVTLVFGLLAAVISLKAIRRNEK